MSSPTTEIPDRTFFRIGDVAEILGVKPYVLRFWETEFPMIHPEKSSTGQRVYKRTDVETLLLIKHLLYGERYSIEGARNRIRQLKREGELKTFQVKEVFGGDDKNARRERLKAFLQDAKELLDLARTPVREFFRA